MSSTVKLYKKTILKKFEKRAFAENVCVNYL